MGRAGSYTLMLIILISITILSCNKNQSVIISQPERIGFEMFTTGWCDGTCDNSDTTITLAIRTSELLIDQVMVMVDGNNLNYNENNHWWELEHVNPGKLIFYSIINENDTLSDSIYIPSKIDSVFCNDVFLRADTTTDYYYDSIYNFSWSFSDSSNLYDYTIYAGFIDRGYIDGLTSKNEIIIKPNYNAPLVHTANGYNVDIQIRKTNRKTLKAGDKPDHESKTMYIYYQISGPIYRAHMFL